MGINFYRFQNPNPKLFNVQTTVISLNSRNLWVHYFAMPTTKVRLFRETEQKRDKNTIKVRKLIALTFPTTEVFIKFNSKTFEQLTFCPLFLKWFV